MSRAKVPPPFRSGFCNDANPADSHRRCPGGWQGRPCVCGCHTPSDEGQKHATPDAEALAAATVPQAVTLVAAAVDCLNSASAGGGMDDLDWLSATHALADLRAALATARTLDSLLATHIYRHGPAGTTDVPGIGAVKVRRGDERKSWDDRGVAQAILDAHLSETGEAPDPWDVVTWLLEAAHVDYWRTGALRAQHIDPDPFCERTPGKGSVQLPKRT